MLLVISGRIMPSVMAFQAFGDVRAVEQPTRKTAANAHRILHSLMVQDWLPICRTARVRHSRPRAKA